METINTFFFRVMMAVIAYCCGDKEGPKPEKPPMTQEEIDLL